MAALYNKERSKHRHPDHLDRNGPVGGQGAMGERVSDPAGLKSAIRRAMDWGKCAVIHVDVDAAKFGDLDFL